MTNKATYISVVEGDLDEYSLEALEKIVEENPWFSLAHMALAKRYFDSNHSGYTDQLGKAAVYVGSPSILYDIIMKPEQSLVHENVDLKVDQVSGPESDVFEEAIEESSGESAGPEEASGLMPPIPKLDELETNLVVEAISDSIEKEVTPVSISEIEDEKLLGNDASNLSSLSQWMLRRSGEVGFTSEPSSFRKKPIVSMSPMDLIDRFIESSPKITPKKVVDYSTENLAKESLVEDESLITETMAKIYAQQGKMEKARRAYRLLSLKYPEKSVYFAAQLKKLGK